MVSELMPGQKCLCLTVAQQFSACAVTYAKEQKRTAVQR